MTVVTQLLSTLIFQHFPIEAGYYAERAQMHHHPFEFSLLVVRRIQSAHSDLKLVVLHSLLTSHYRLYLSDVDKQYRRAYVEPLPRRYVLLALGINDILVTAHYQAHAQIFGWNPYQVYY